MTFEKHLRSVSRAASQRLGILRKSWRVFRDRSLLGRCFRGFVLPVLEYCSAVWCSAADTHLKLLDRAVSGARFPAGGNISHRRSVAVQCMLYKIRCNPVHPLNGLYLYRMCQRGLHAVLWLHIGTLMHRHAAEHCSTAELFFLSRYPTGTILLSPFWQGQCFFIGLSCSIPTIVFYPFSLSLLSVYRLVLWGWGLRTARVSSLSLSLALPTFFNNNNNNNDNIELYRGYLNTVFIYHHLLNKSLNYSYFVVAEHIIPLGNQL